MAVLPTGLAGTTAAQRLRCRLGQTIRARRLRGVLRRLPHPAPPTPRSAPAPHPAPPRVPRSARRAAPAAHTAPQPTASRAPRDHQPSRQKDQAATRINRPMVIKSTVTARRPEDLTSYDTTRTLSRPRGPGPTRRSSRRRGTPPKRPDPRPNDQDPEHRQTKAEPTMTPAHLQGDAQSRFAVQGFEGSWVDPDLDRHWCGGPGWWCPPASFTKPATPGSQPPSGRSRTTPSPGQSYRLRPSPQYSP